MCVLSLSEEQSAKYFIDDKTVRSVKNDHRLFFVCVKLSINDANEMFFSLTLKMFQSEKPILLLVVSYLFASSSHHHPINKIIINKI